MRTLCQHHQHLHADLPEKHGSHQQLVRNSLGLLVRMQEQHLLRSGRQTGVECTLERDFAPYSPALLELVTCMLQHKTQRKSAEELLQLPVLAQLSDL